MRRRLGGITFAAGLPVAAAVVGSLGARSAPRVYDELEKPAWAPPASAFGPVWTILYGAIGVVGWRLWTRNAPQSLLGLHAGQLALNAAWPIAFFAIRSRPASLGVIVALDAAVAAEVAATLRRDPAAAALLSPYLLWCLFATALNAAVQDPGA